MLRAIEKLHLRTFAGVHEMPILTVRSRNVLSDPTAAVGCECLIVVLIGCIEVNKQYMARSLVRFSKCATSDRKSETRRSTRACPHSPAPRVFVVEHENPTLTSAPRGQKKRANDWRALQQTAAITVRSPEDQVNRGNVAALCEWAW